MMYKIVSFNNTFNFNLIPNSIFDSHEQVLDFWLDAIAKGFIQKGATLILFDTHSDIKLCEHHFFTTKANWINVAIQEGLISKVIWVVPNTLPAASGRQSRKAKDTTLGISSDVPYKDYITLFSKKGELKTRESLGDWMPDLGGYEKVKLKVVRLADLGSLLADTREAIDPENIHVSFDYDYWSNCGHDTHRNIVINPSEEQLLVGIDLVFSTLNDLNVRPRIFTASRSPAYVGNVRHSDILEAKIGGYLKN